MAAPYKYPTEEAMAEAELRRQEAFRAANEAGDISSPDVQDLLSVISGVGNPAGGISTYLGGKLADRWTEGGLEVAAEDVFGPPGLAIMGMANPIGMVAGRGVFSKLGNLFSAGKRKVGDFFGTSPVGHGNMLQSERLIKNLSPAQEAAISKHKAWIEANPRPPITAPEAADDLLHSQYRPTPPPHPTPEQLKQAKIYQLQREVLGMGDHKLGNLTPAQADAMMWPPPKPAPKLSDPPVPDFDLSNFPELNP